MVNNLWKNILEREFIFEKECYKTCNSFCCRWEHEDFPRFFIPKGGTLFYLPEEYNYIKSNAMLSDGNISQLSINLYDNKKVSIYYTACNDDRNCNIKFTRTLYCRIYPFFPVFNMEGELLDLKYISIYDITSDIIGLKTPCYVKNKKEVYLKLWQKDKELLNILKNPYLLFHFMVADILYNNYCETLKESGLLSYRKEEFWVKWERLYLKKRLINKEKATKDINELYKKFCNEYNDRFSL